MRIRHVLLSSAISMCLSIGLAPPAVAQGFFQKLLGLDGPQQQPEIQRPQTRIVPSYRFQSRPRPYQPWRQPADDEMIGPPDSSGPYQTVCVRACDGYYFPLRHNAWRKNFEADARSCRTACGGEARLFYYALRGGNTANMADLAGRRYEDLPNAFRYRKTLVQGCTCKPEPWSYEEAARHRGYAEDERMTAGAQVAQRSITRAGTSEYSEAEPQGSPEPAAAQPELETSAETYEPIRPSPAKPALRRRKFPVVRRDFNAVRYRHGTPASGTLPGLF